MSNDFLDLLDTVKAEEASASRLFNTSEDGRGIRSMTKKDPRYLRSLAEAAKLVADVTVGKQPVHRLEEAMSTSDFPLLFGDVIDRSMLGRYNEWPATWAKIAKRGSVKDFRTKRQFIMDGAESALSEVKQGAPYPASSLTEGKYDYSLKKYGRRLPFFWEVFINDDLDALRDAPDRLAKAARMTEERLATELYVDSTGPDATFFTSGNGNLAAAGTDLTPETLGAGLTSMKTRRDADGNPIFPGRVRLVVPPQLEIKAKTIVNATQIVVAPGATTGMQTIGGNVVGEEVVEVVVNPWLPIIDTTNGDGAWYLFAEPGIGRPALEVGFLRGHESPELFMKSPNATRISGAAVGAGEGDFDTDSIDYKVRHVTGGRLLEPKAAYANPGV